MAYNITLKVLAFLATIMINVIVAGVVAVGVNALPFFAFSAFLTFVGGIVIGWKF